MNNEKLSEYQFFICYTRDSAEDLALHLWNGLEKREISAFLDLKNIPKKAKNIEWWKFRDDALRNSATVILIITHGFEKSEEVKKEISLALDEDKDFLLLRYSDLDKNVIVVLKDKEVNLGEYNQIVFDTKEELLRKVLSSYSTEKTTHAPKLIAKPKLLSLDEKLVTIEQKTGYYPTLVIDEESKICVYYNTFSQTIKEIQSEVMSVTRVVCELFSDKERVILTLNKVHDYTGTIAPVEPEIVTVVFEMKDWSKISDKTQFWNKLHFFRRILNDKYLNGKAPIRWRLVP